MPTKKGKTLNQIAQNLSVARSTVHDIIKLFKLTGKLDVERKTGRRPFLTFN